MAKLNYSAVAPLISDKVMWVGVSFNNKSLEQYHFKSTILDLEEGDLVVVQSNGPLEYNIARVVDVSGEYMPNDMLQYKWIIQRVNVEAAKKVFEGEDAMIRKLVRAERLKVQNEIKVLLRQELSLSADDMAELTSAINQPEEETG